MTVIHYKKNLLCGENCHEKFSKTIVTLCPEFKESFSGHTTLTHGKEYHEIFVTFYDKGVHENWTPKGIIKTKFNDKSIHPEIQKKLTKYTGYLPTKSELENL